VFNGSFSGDSSVARIKTNWAQIDLDVRSTEEENGRMKYLIFFCLIVVLIPISGTTAQVQPLDQPGPDCCSKYKVVIVSPPKDIDFKLIIIVPPKIDQAMVVNPFQASNQLSSPPKASNPESDKKVEQFFKLPPFPTAKSGSSVVHFWNQ
jgi:hypothetical protein